MTSKKKKVVVILLLVFAMVFSLSACSVSKDLFRVRFKVNGTEYSISLSDNMKLYSWDDKTEQTKSVKLTTKQYSSLTSYIPYDSLNDINTVSDIESTSEQNNPVEIVVRVNGELTTSGDRWFEYGNSQNEDIDELMKLLFKLSPTPILNSDNDRIIYPER